MNFQTPSISNSYLNNNVSIPTPYGFGRGSKRGSAPCIRIGPKNFKKEDGQDVCALIITINSGGSFDQLYREVEQTAPTPEQYTSVFEASYDAVTTIAKYLENYKPDLQHTLPDLSSEEDENMKQLVTELYKLEPESIVINWECCGGCSKEGFPILGENVFRLTKEAIQRKFTVIFSDFSLMAMISKWDAELGPNPFKQVGSFSNCFALRFDPATLSACPFSQLQNVGELCENGKATVGAMSGTILYSLDDQYISDDQSRKDLPYQLEVLSIVESAEGHSNFLSSFPSSLLTLTSNGVNTNEAGEKSETSEIVKGLAGHCVITFPSGGRILTSCGHWIELIKLDASMESALKHAERSYGVEFASNLRNNWSNCSEEQQSEYVRQYANCEVQKSAPCQYKKSFNS